MSSDFSRDVLDTGIVIIGLVQSCTDLRTAITDPEGNLLFTLKAHVWKQTYNFTGTNSAGEEVFKVNMGWMKGE